MQHYFHFSKEIFCSDNLLFAQFTFLRYFYRHDVCLLKN